MTTDKTELEKDILALRGKGYSCSETTMAALCHAFESGIDEDTLRNIAVGFRGGIGGTFADGTCGALSGAVMAAGIILGQDRKATVAVARNTFNDFRECHGTVACGMMYDKGRDHCNNCCIRAASKAFDEIKAAKGE